MSAPLSRSSTGCWYCITYPVSFRLQLDIGFKRPKKRLKNQIFWTFSVIIIRYFSKYLSRLWFCLCRSQSIVPNINHDILSFN